MSEFWWGVLSLPIVLASIGVAAGALLGGWRALEWWYENRIVGLRQPARFGERPGPIGFMTVSHLGDRRQIVSALAVVPRCIVVNIFPGRAVVFVGKGHKVNLAEQKRVWQAIEKAMHDIATEEAQ